MCEAPRPAHPEACSPCLGAFMFNSVVEHGKIESMSNRRRMLFHWIAVSIALPCLALAGCKNDVLAHQRSDIINQYRVPKAAKPVAEGVGVIEFTAPDRGLLYIIDLDQPRTLSNPDNSYH